MALDSIDKLSDDDGARSPPKKTPKASPKKKASPKAKPRTSAKNKIGKPKDSSAESPSVPKPKPKATLKRPASALPAAPAAGSMMKPAAAKGRGKGGRKGKNPDHVSVCKSKYKSNGVWSIKLWQKEVCRVLWWQYFKHITYHNYLKKQSETYTKNYVVLGFGIQNSNCYLSLFSQVKPHAMLSDDEVETIAVSWPPPALDLPSMANSEFKVGCHLMISGV